MGLMTEYIHSGIDFNEELMSLIKKYNELRETYLLVYASAVEKPIGDISLTNDDYFTIYDILKDVDSENLDFYLETPGGKGEAAEEICRFIRSKFKIINFVISGEAKSAGTILALSGDEILMTNSGSLGPIDAQMRIGRSFISAYDYMEWVEEKRAEAGENGFLNPFDAIMVAQINPGELKLVNVSLELGKKWVVDWLAEYKFKNWTVTETNHTPVSDEMRRARAQEIADELANHSRWGSHGRSLKIEDLEELKLQITKVDDDPELADIVYRIQTVIRLLLAVNTPHYKIFATEEETLFKQKPRENLPSRIPAQDVTAADVSVECPKCKETQKLYFKFVDDPKIDEDLQKKGLKPFPKDSKLKCSCGDEIDLTPLKKQIETQAGKNIIL